MKRMILSVLAFALAGCASGNKLADHKLAPENSPDVVIGRIDGMSERPSWLHEAEPFKVMDGKVTTLGSTEIPADHRLESAYRIAQNNAKSLIASSIEQRLDFILQNAQEGTTVDASQVRYIGAEASKITTSSLRPDKVYWEKVAVTRDSGERVTQYRVFATVTMPEAEFKTAIFNAIKKAQGQGSISQDFKQKVDAKWDEFVGAQPTQAKAPEQRQPSNSESAE